MKFKGPLRGGKNTLKSRHPRSRPKVTWCHRPVWNLSFRFHQDRHAICVSLVSADLFIEWIHRSTGPSRNWTTRRPENIKQPVTPSTGLWVHPSIMPCISSATNHQSSLSWYRPVGESSSCPLHSPTEIPLVVSSDLRAINSCRVVAVMLSPAIRAADPYGSVRVHRLPDPRLESRLIVPLKR